MNVNSTGLRPSATGLEPGAPRDTWGKGSTHFCRHRLLKINRDVESHWVDLRVIGERGGTELDEALFGSVTKHVLYEALSDVLVDSPKTWYGGNRCTTSNNSHPSMVFCASVRHL